LFGSSWLEEDELLTFAKMNSALDAGSQPFYSSFPQIGRDALKAERTQKTRHPLRKPVV